MKKNIILVLLFIGQQLIAHQEDPLFYGETSDTFIVRWAFKKNAHLFLIHVFYGQQHHLASHLILN